MLVDSHAHLDMPQFDSDRDDVIQRARDAGVELILTIGSGNPETTSIENALALAENNDFIFAGLGVHPHDARSVDDSYWQRVEQWIRHPKVVLWGEIGLDYHYDYSPRECQREIFRRQIQMARECSLPVSIHCRDAWADLMAILEQEWNGADCRGILHSFTGTLEQARKCAAMGFLVSFSGIVTFKGAESLRRAAQGLGLDQVLVETDCPYLAPVPHRGKRNEPAYVLDVAKSLAQTMGTSLETLALATTNNIRRLLAL
jgi:TatD DNase family protein